MNEFLSVSFMLEAQPLTDTSKYGNSKSKFQKEINVSVQVYQSLAHVTKAKFLCDPSLKTPVFVRFSTVLGSRGTHSVVIASSFLILVLSLGSADTVRDVRGFATKFYTAEGNFDLVGNNIPVFFIQDAIKVSFLSHIRVYSDGVISLMAVSFPM